MNEPPNSGMNQPPGYNQPPQNYGQPPGYGQPHPQSYAQPLPHSGSYAPPPQHAPRTGFTRQMFNPAMYRQPGSGSWAAASLVLSLVSMFLCIGLLAPLPLIFGFVGMIGNKRAKGMAFAGFLLSAFQIAGWVAIMALGLHLQFQSGTMAEDAGKPVVAAIEDFKNDHKRVPNSLEELVIEGYLPATWDYGLEEIDGNVSKAVKGKKWTDFLRYRPGGDATWAGEYGWADDKAGSEQDDWNQFFTNPTGDGQVYQTYGLAFIGLDNTWDGSSDNAAVNQSPEKPYALDQLWGGDEATRDAMKSKRELQRMMSQIDQKLTAIDQSVTKNQTKLGEHEAKLRGIMDKKSLQTLEQVKKDRDAGEWLKLVGETARLVEAIENKRVQLQSDRNRLEVQIERLGNQVEMAKLAGNKDELAKLQVILDESRATLEKDDSYFAKVSEDEAAEKWFEENFD